MKKINSEYLGVWKEFPLFAAIWLWHSLQPHKAPSMSTILIVNPCLIGDFAASIPAIRAFIAAHSENKVDLLVSPSLQSLARHITGVGAVYTVRSVYRRKEESAPTTVQALPTSYGSIVILRMSSDAFRVLSHIHAHTIQTSLTFFLKYLTHLFFEAMRGGVPTPWREINFRMLNIPVQSVTFEKMFTFDRETKERILQLPELNRSEPRIIIHPKASWIMNQWPLEYWVMFMKMTHAKSAGKMILVGAENDADLCKKISAALDFPAAILTGLPLSDLLLVMRECNYFIGIDSGPRNLAHLADLPSVTILGPAPHLFSPPNARDIVIDHSNGKKAFERFVAKSSNRLIDTVTPQEVFDAFLELQNRISESPPTETSASH